MLTLYALFLNPLIPKSDQLIISPYNCITLNQTLRSQESGK